MAGFPVFNPIPNGYVEPTPNYRITPGSPLPTNSWAQNAVKGTVVSDAPFTGTWPPFSPGSRDTKPFPWFVSPYYGDGEFGTNPFILLGHTSINEYTHSTELGNNDLSIAAQGFIDRLTVTGKDKLFLINLDDGSATYSLEDTVNMTNPVKFYTSRGSPFVNMNFLSATMINLLFTSLVQITIIPQVVYNGIFYISAVPFSYNHTTTSVTTYFTGSIIYTVYDRYTAVGTTELRSFTFNGTVPLLGEIYSDSVLVGRFGPYPEKPDLPPGTFTSFGGTWDPASNTLTIGNRVIFIFPNFSRTLNNVVHQHNVTFLSKSPFTIQKLGGTLSIVSTGAGDLWIYCDDNQSYVMDANLGYVTSMVAKQNGSGGKYNLDLTVLSGSSIYTYTPRWWQENYNISSITYLGGVFFDVAYGNCILANILAPVSPHTLGFTPKNPLVLPTSPTIPPGIDNAINIEAFRKRIRDDMEFYKYLNVPFNSGNAYAQQSCYVFAQNIAKYGRILVFAHLTGVLTSDEMSDTYIELLNSWLNSTNGASQNNKPDSNQLRFETRWGGVITLADYYFKIYPGQGIEGSFNNSFYNDHHFQYSYFFNALYSLYLIEKRSTLTTYIPQIKQLLQDVVTSYNDPTSKSIKTRHKDWFFGHSFATGLIQASNIDQESVSEAINCYYSAWLLSGAMYTLTADPSFLNMRDISEAALYTEMYTAKLFWTANGDIINTPSTTIVKAFTKTFSAHAGGQPSSYPSNSLYRYSIISIPFTDITPLFLDKDWVFRFSTAVNWQRVNKLLIAGLTNYEDAKDVWSYKAIPSPYDNNTDESPHGITSWGFVGLQLLALGNVSNNVLTGDEALRYYNKIEDKIYTFNQQEPLTPLNEDIIKRFDSLSNAFYILYYLADFNSITPVVGPDNINNVFMNGHKLKNCSKRQPPKINTSTLKNTVTDITTPVTEVMTLNSDIESLKVFNNILSPSALKNMQLKCKPCKKYVEVPTIEIFATPDSSEFDVGRVIFTIRDIISYDKPRKYRKKWNCLKTGKVPKEDVIITTFVLFQPECNFNTVLNADGNFLIEKCRNINAIVPYIIQYTYIKWVLCRILYGSFDLNFLRRSFNSRFFRDLSKSRFRGFIEYFTSPSLIDYNGLLYDVIGYGDAPQQGIYYYIL
jgi:hypothetical protein